MTIVMFSKILHVQKKRVCKYLVLDDIIFTPTQKPRFTLAAFTGQFSMRKWLKMIF